VVVDILLPLCFSYTLYIIHASTLWTRRWHAFPAPDDNIRAYKRRRQKTVWLNS